MLNNFLQFKDWLSRHSYELLAGVFAILSPIKPLILATIFVIFVDFIFGVLAARKQGIPITSAKMRDTIGKFIVYSLAIIAGFIVEKYLIGEIFPLTKLVGFFIGTAEFKSILENASIIREEDIFRSIINKLGSANKDEEKKD